MERVQSHNLATVLQRAACRLISSVADHLLTAGCADSGPVQRDAAAAGGAAHCAHA